MTKKKILHVVYSGLGGHGNVFFSMVDADRSAEYDYAGVFMGIEPMKEEYTRKCEEKKIPYHAVLKKRGLDIGGFYKTYKAIKKERPDIVFLHGPLNIIPGWVYRLSRGFRAKVLLRDTQSNHLKSKQDWFWLFVSMALAGKILFLSEQFEEDVRRRFGIFYSKRKTKVIPNGIDLGLFHPRTEVARADGRFIIGMQSRLEPIKDYPTLLEAFAALKGKPFFSRVELHIAGDGTKRQELEMLAVELGIADKVRFLGMLHEKQLVQFLQSLDIYIHASHGETMSTAIMQSMACRLPVIASDVKGINNMVFHEKNGLLVKVKDVNEMATAIDRLISNESDRERLAMAAYDYAREKFSNERMLSEYKKIFEE